MNCHAFQQRLNTVLDDRKSPQDDSDLVGHAATCDSCSRALGLSVQLFYPSENEHRVVSDVLAISVADEETVQRRSRGFVRSSKLFSAVQRFAGVGAMVAGLLFVALLIRPARVVESVVSKSDVQATSNDSDLPLSSAIEMTALAPIALSSVANDVSTGSHAVIEEGPAAFVYQPLVSLGMASTTEWNYAIKDIDIPFAAQVPDVTTTWMGVVHDGIAPVQQSMSKTIRAIRLSLSS